MENSLTGALVGSEIHGFHTLQALDVRNIMEEARTRWLRPNEIYAILCNYKYFGINAKPVHLPKSGTIVLFDRKMLRNFRKDGHNWKKKKDGKTVKEAHEHLKVGNEERIHVYYAHGLDNPTFVRRCYWLLDKVLENIVLVHYRETQESQGSPATHYSNSSSVSDPSATWLVSEEMNSEATGAYQAGQTELSGSGDRLTTQNHEMRLHEINTLEWDELVTDDPNYKCAFKEGLQPQRVPFFEQHNSAGTNSVNNGGLSTSVSPLDNIGHHFTGVGLQTNSNPSGDYDTLSNSNSIHFIGNSGLQNQDNFGQWMNYITAEPQDSPDGATVDSSLSSCYYTNASPEMDNMRSLVPELRFSIIDIAPTWAYSNEETKILVTGFFREEHTGCAQPNLICVSGELCLHTEVVQAGVYRCLLPPQPSGLVNLFMSIDGHNPISQVVNFEYRSPPAPLPLSSAEDKLKLEELSLKTRLALLLFSAPRSLDIASFKVTSAVRMEAKKFTFRTSNVMREWAYLISSVEDSKTSLQKAKDSLFDLMLKTRLKDWILERVICGYKASEYDVHGQGVIHLCAILGYTWAVSLFSWSGLSLDIRDKFGWTALHWAAYCGREDMVAKLLSAGAKPNMVTDPTPENPGGCTAADLASKKGYDGLAAYLAEKALVQHFEDMSIAGNVCGALQTGTNNKELMENISEEELFLKDSLAAYRLAADAAARIQAAFREHSFKLRTKRVEYLNAEDDARNIIAAMKIQHAFRNFDSKKKMAAAARIQYTFRTWKTRKEFLHLRNQAIRIQAAFRGFQVRRLYRKILWSVGVLEKAVLRWRMKRKGFRGFHIELEDNMTYQMQDSDTEDDFFRTSRRQAEDRLERSVVKVQAIFRSKKAQEQYSRTKMAHVQAKLEYDNMLVADGQMER